MDSLLKKSASTELEDLIQNACVAFNNAFKHQREMKEDYNDLKLITFGTTLDCILPAPLGDVVYLTNSDYLKELNNTRNYKWYSKIFEGKRLDLILYEIKQILGEEK